MSEHSGQHNRTILVVDDQEMNIDLMRHFLEMKGYQVTSASDGSEAIGAVEREGPDAIILDLVMPGMNGLEVCRRIKQDPETRHIPVIILTGAQDHEANVKAMEAGADDFLQRPFDALFLDARIRSCVRAKVLQDQILRYQQQLENQNEVLERGIGERTAQLQRTQQATVFSLAKLAESRDPETGEHLDRIRRYARQIARELALWPGHRDEIDEDFVEVLYQSSPLHDIGKVGIPDNILLKPGKLTHDEFEVMKTHAAIGGETLEAADHEAGQNSFLRMGRDIAFYHHERWDGTGYPHGMKGEEIPLAARIVSLADTYDALVSKRPYKEPMPHEQAREVILEGRATQFDPDVVDAFLAREPRFVSINTRLREPEEPPPLPQLASSLSDSTG